MRKKKSFCGILTSMLLAFAIPMASFAQPDAGVTTGNEKKIETVLTPQEQEENTEAYTKIYDALLAYEESIDLSEYKLTGDEAVNLYQRVVNENADLFYVGSLPDYEYHFESMDFEDWNLGELFVSDIFPLYGAEKEQIADMKTEFQAAMEEALSGLEETMTDGESLVSA